MSEVEARYSREVEALSLIAYDYQLVVDSRIEF